LYSSKGRDALLIGIVDNIAVCCYAVKTEEQLTSTFSEKAKQMREAVTWRELLGRSIENLQERQRIANAMGVIPITLMRWANGESTPRW